MKLYKVGSFESCSPKRDSKASVACVSSESVGESINPLASLVASVVKHFLLSQSFEKLRRGRGSSGVRMFKHKAER